MIVFWIPIVAGALVGKLLGGKVHSVTSLHLRHYWLVPVVAVTHTLLVFMPPRLPEEGIEPLRVLVPLGAWAIVVFAALNLRVRGMAVVLAGALANALVMTANGGLMPVSAEVLSRAGMSNALAFGQAHTGARLHKTKDVLLAPEVTNLAMLSDVLVTPPLPRVWFTSVGDLALAIGLGTVVVAAMRGEQDADGAKHTHQQEARCDATDTIPPWVRHDALRARRTIRADTLHPGGALA